jgi:Cof subfamily protein (haloacid dehalogenase superfamily)
MYRLVFCDLDGTVATFDGQVRPAVQQAMQAVVDAGHCITLCTSRGYQMVKPFLDRVSVNAPMICCTGGLIVEAHTRVAYHVQPLPLSLAHDLVRLSLQEDIAMWFYLADMETMLERRVGDRGYALRRDGETLREVSDAVHELTEAPHKVLIETRTVEESPAIVAKVQEYVGDQARVLISSPRRIEVVLPGLSKGWAMSWVASYLGIEREETIGIGDGDNDVEMLEWAGLGIAMGNATPRTRAVADWIAPSVQEDGLAEALRRFVLEPAT